MYELVNKGFQALWGIWRFRWIALATAWLVAVLGWTVVYKMEHKYFATARIYVDTNQVLEPLLSGLAIQPDVKQRVALMSKTLLSRPNLENLVETTGLARDFADPRDKELALNTLSGDLSLYDATGTGSLYTIGYAHSDPAIAGEVVQSLIDIFIDSNLGEEREDNSAAQEFLDARIDDYEGRLTAAETRLSDFKRENAGSMPGEAGGYYQRIQQAEAQLRTATLALREAENRRNRLQRQLDNESPVLFSTDPGWVPADVARIQTLRDQLDALLVRYTDRHPQVAQLRETIAGLEEERERAVAEQGDQGSQRPDGRASTTPSLVHQQVSTMLAETEGRIAELQVRVRQYEAELRALEDTVDSIPQVEARLAQLDRDYETIRDQHDTLLARRESARLTAAVKRSSDNVKFRVVDPPFVSARPGVPNKKLLNVGVLGAAVAGGIALSFLLALLMPVFYDRRSLALATGVPVLGGVSLQRSFRDKTRYALGLVMLAMLYGLLLLTAGLLVLLEYQGTDLPSFLERHSVPLLADLLRSDTWQDLIESAPLRYLDSWLERLL